MHNKSLKNASSNPQTGLLNPKLKRLFPQSNKSQNVETEKAKLVALFQSGAFEECVVLAEKLSKQYPKQGVFWKILGTVQQNLANNTAAITALKQAQQCLPKDAEVLYNLGNAFFDLAQHEEAIAAYQQSIALVPDFDKAYFNLASVYEATAASAEAEAAYRQAIALNPDEIKTSLKLAAFLEKQDRVEEAIVLLSSLADNGHASYELYQSLAIEFARNKQVNEAKGAYEEAIRLAPDNINLYHNYGLYLQEQKAYQAAEQYFLQGITVADASVEILCSLGMLYYEIERLDQAEHCFKQALVSFPDSALGYVNFALFMFNTGKVLDAVRYGLKALEIDPDNVPAMNNLGLAYQACGQFEDSVAQFKQALDIDPNNIAALSNITLPLKRMGLLSEAESYLKHGIALNPQAHDVLVNLASIYQAQGKIIEASEVNLQAIEIAPEKLMPYHNLLFDMCYSSSFSRETIMTQLKRYGTMATEVATLQFDCWQTKPAGAPIRVGFVSADFILHPVTSFLSTVLAHVDPVQFELFAYSNNAKVDFVTQKIKPYFKTWRSIVGQSDENAARQIHADGIDILIDLSGHTGGTRIPMFAYKPAPVQVTWLGYWASTGIEQMDYILLDELSAPVNFQDQFTEQVCYLPSSRFCYSPPEEQIALTPLPALQNGYVTLGCYHNYSKVTDAVLDLWCDVMRAGPNLQIRWITTAFKDDLIVESMQAKFIARGIPKARIALLASLPRHEYLESFNAIDVMIDAFPFTSCTTASDGLWMGVPTLAMAGNSLVARQSTSLMHAVNLPEWVAEDAQSYISKMLAFTQDLDRLSDIRANLRSWMQASPLGNAALFTQNLEKALGSIWQTYQQQQVQLPSDHHGLFTHVNSDVLTKQIVVVATTKSQADFWAQTATGLSLKKMAKQGTAFSHYIAYENQRGLPEIYNAAIDAAPDDAQLVLVHDDVWFDQQDVLAAIDQGLQQFDIIGVVGNTRRAPKQANWLYITPQEMDDAQYLSGQVACGEVPNGLINTYGAVGLACEALDGLLLAVNVAVLKANAVRFDTRFKFHYYDMDFCRTAREAGIQLGTWGLGVTHQSGGNFDQQWYAAYQQYLAKWEPDATPYPFDAASDALSESIQAVLAIAKEHLENGQLEEAIAVYQEILTIAPDQHEVVHQYALILANQQRWEEATSYFENAAALVPDNVQYCIDYIDALRLKGDVAKAKEVLAQAKVNGLDAALYDALNNDLNVAAAM